MFWVAALLSLIIWLLGLASGFLGFGIHLFLLFAVLSGLAALLPSAHETLPGEDDTPPDGIPANSMPATASDAANAPTPHPAEEQKVR